MGKPNGVGADHAEPNGCGCAFVLAWRTASERDEPACRACAAPGSAYCHAHHALCHLPPEASPNGASCREIEALAEAVGGRSGRPARHPPTRFCSAWTGFAGVLRAHVHVYVQERRMTDGERKTRRTARQTLANGDRRRRNGWRHGPIERLAAVDRRCARAGPSRPYRALDTLAIMERRGSITAGMRQAGEDFRARFATGPTRPAARARSFAAAARRPPARRGDEAPGLRIEAARDAVWRAIQAVGGIASPAGSCVWHVVGWECSLKAWALEQGWNGRRVSQEAASGILIAALGALEAHFGNRRTMRKSQLLTLTNPDRSDIRSPH